MSISRAGHNAGRLPRNRQRDLPLRSNVRNAEHAKSRSHLSLILETTIRTHSLKTVKLRKDHVFSVCQTSCVACDGFKAGALNQNKTLWLLSSLRVSDAMSLNTHLSNSAGLLHVQDANEFPQDDATASLFSRIFTFAQ